MNNGGTESHRSQSSEAPARQGPFLAFDTSSSTGSVAVGAAGAVLAEATLEQQGQHASRLVPTIDFVLREAGIALGDISGVVVGEGPGSFTGVRVAAATAKGLVHGVGCALWAVSSLVAAALSVGGTGVRYVLFDARGGRVYGACCRVGAAGVDVVRPPHAGSLEDVLAGELPRDVLFVGDGSDAHRDVLEGAGLAVAEPPPVHPSAQGLLRYISLVHSAQPIVDVDRWEPHYVRDWQSGRQATPKKA